MGLHLKQAGRTKGKPLAYRQRNVVEDINRITIVGVENHSSLDVQTIDPPGGQIRRADVRSLSTPSEGKVECLRVVIAVSVAHDSKMGVGAREPEKVDQLMQCACLRLTVIGTNKDDRIELLVGQALERGTEHTEDTSLEKSRLPPNADNIRRQHSAQPQVKGLFPGVLMTVVNVSHGRTKKAISSRTSSEDDIALG